VSPRLRVIDGGRMPDPSPERMAEIFALADEAWEQYDAATLREANASHAWLAQHPPDWSVIAAATGWDDTPPAPNLRVVR
jgi:hypothetical protein